MSSIILCFQLRYQFVFITRASLVERNISKICIKYFEITKRFDDKLTIVGVLSMRNAYHNLKPPWNSIQTECPWYQTLESPWAHVRSCSLHLISKSLTRLQIYSLNHSYVFNTFEKQSIFYVWVREIWSQTGAMMFLIQNSFTTDWVLLWSQRYSRWWHWMLSLSLWEPLVPPVTTASWRLDLQWFSTHQGRMKHTYVD